MKHFKNNLFALVFLLAASCTGNSSNSSGTDSTAVTDSGKIASSDTLAVSKPEISAPDVTLKVPEGFSTTIFASGLGKARHIAVAPGGDVYVKINGMVNGKTIVLLKDKNNDGVADEQSVFGDFKGTGMAIKNGYVYASSDKEVYRFKLNDNGTVSDPGNPEKIVTGLIARNEHEAKSIALDDDGNLFVNIGAFSNSCQVEDRKTGSLGMKPCPVLDSAAGI